MDPFQPMHSGDGIQLSFQKQIVNKKCKKYENCALPIYFLQNYGPLSKKHNNPLPLTKKQCLNKKVNWKKFEYNCFQAEINL